MSNELLTVAVDELKENMQEIAISMKQRMSRFETAVIEILTQIEHSVNKLEMRMGRVEIALDKHSEQLNILCGRIIS